MPIRKALDSLFGRALAWAHLAPQPAPEPAPPPEATAPQSVGVRGALESLFGRVLNRPSRETDSRYSPEDLAAIARGEAGRRRTDGTASLAMLVAHQEQFAAKWGVGINVYWSRFDEALRDNWINALAMRRSTFIEELLNSRKIPIAGLEWHIEVDDNKDPDQKKASEQLHKCVQSTPHFCSLRYYLGEDKWQGKYGSQITWGVKPIDGREMVGVTSHEPVDGDSIVYRYDKTPGILVRTGWTPKSEGDRAHVEQPDPTWIQAADRARALFLHDQFWRDHFIISNFNPRSADYLYGGDQAAAIFGVGYRGLMYWDFQLREELRSWLIEALQRVGVNGMLYGFFESGNVKMMQEVLVALKLLHRDNVTAFPYLPGQTPEEIRHIEPAQIGYDILAHWINELEESMRRCVLGQSLSAMAQSTGMGSEVAKLHEQTLQLILRSDAAAQQETLTTDLLNPMVRMNQFEWRGKMIDGRDLPFTPRFVYSLDKADVKERSDTIVAMYNIGLPLSKEQVYADVGLAPPKGADDILKKPDEAPGGPGGSPGGPPPAGGAKHPEALAALAHANSKPEGNPKLNVSRGADGKMRISAAKYGVDGASMGDVPQTNGAVA